MDKIQAKANKFLNEVNKRKSRSMKSDDKDQIQLNSCDLADLSKYCCVYCRKIFFNSRCLMKHVMRRHSDELILLHKSCAKRSSNNVSDAQYIMTLLKEEFTKFKNELTAEKLIADGRSSVGLPQGIKVSEKEINDDNYNRNKGTGNTADFHSEEVCSDKICDVKKSMQCLCEKFEELDSMQKGGVKLKQNFENFSKKISEINKNMQGLYLKFEELDGMQKDGVKWKQDFENFSKKISEINKNMQGLCLKFEELDYIVNNDVMRKQDASKYFFFNEEQVHQAQECKFNELRQELLSDLSKKLQDNNQDWNSQLTELIKEIKRLNLVIDSVKNQVECSDSLKDIEKRLEQHITNFLSHSKHGNVKKIDQSHSKTKPSGDKADCHHKQKKKSKSSIIQDKGCNSSECMENSKTPLIKPHEISFLLDEKLSRYGITPNTFKMSSKEYDKKLKLLNSEKQQLSKKNPQFLEIYNNISMEADYRALQESKNRRCRKIRFSDPLTSCEKMPKTKTLINHKQLKISTSIAEDCKSLTIGSNQKFSDAYSKIPVPQKENSIPESQGFLSPDLNGAGDYTCKFINGQNLNPVTHKVQTSVKEFKTSSPIIDIHESNEVNLTFSNDSSVCSSQTSFKIPKSTAPEKSKQFVSSSRNQQEKGSKMSLCENLNKCDETEGDGYSSEEELESLSSYDGD